MAGRMGYLADRRGALRADPRLLLTNARSVLCVGMLYNTQRDTSLEGDQGWISRYAWGADYHDLLSARLEALVARLHAEWGAFDSKICVDTAPLLERALARRRRAGLARPQHLPHQRGDRIVVFPRRGAGFRGRGAGHAAAGPLRHLHALHRGLPDAGTRSV